ncbi:serine/threonine-protein phosphatase 7 long form homolog [Dioscorea cayenensis subsp. rotundata]|uniref:Serine/threonine-protein phosphatase 7 long form homolog n=1 Tax=Dioscorea cayennensis subsp. rotundata TaxID=55577 RepID=A0AB40CJN0_DIOCR|nr:serine/threonine-protein phosphatase 7 long form homolog [Dioscorea cayenensis subsp. rotundata]
MAKHVYVDNLPDRVLRCRHVSIVEPPPEIVSLLREAEFYHEAQIRNFRIDATLVSTLVERWRTETHTFHLTCCETTITLEDVALLLGLPINGHEVIGQTSGLGSAVCAELLGVVPSVEQRKGQSITLTWLEETFGMLPYDASQHQIEYYARAYILRLIGCVLMPDMSQNRFHLKWLPLLRDFTEAGRYSWGAACLDFKYIPSNPCYRNLSSGLKVLIIVDYLANNFEQFIWRPYDSNKIIAQVPHDIFADRPLWTAFTSLICFEVVEWHQTDRVTKQFGFAQGVPLNLVCIGLTHDHDLRGRIDTDWALMHKRWIGYWRDRASRCLSLHILAGNNAMSVEYYDWYTTNTILFLSTDQDLLDPRTRANTLPAPLRAFPTVVVDVSPPSPPARRRRQHNSRAKNDEAHIP